MDSHNLAVQLTIENRAFLDEGNVRHAEDCSPRLNEVLDRYRAVFHERGAFIRSFINPSEILELADARMIGGRESPWLSDWVAYCADLADEYGVDVQTLLERRPLLRKISELALVDLMMLEELVESAIHG